MSEPVPRDTLLDDLTADQSKGGVVHTFNPESSTAEKAASAGKAASKLKRVSGGGARQPQELKVADGAPRTPVPVTVTPRDVGGAGESDVTKKEPLSPAVDESNMPCALTGPTQNIPDWYKVGWRDATGVDAPVPAGEDRDKRVLHMFISEQYYGEWFHNAGVIFFAVASTYFLTIFRMGWGWLFIILAGCGTYYTNSMKTLRRAVRDDIQRELVKTRLVKDHETADWMNNFLDRFWLIYEPVLARTVVSSVDQILSTSAPPMIESMAMSTFTLGTKAPRIEKIRTFPHTPEDEVVMDWDISFSSTDLSNDRAVGKSNSKIVLDVKIGKGPARIPMSILVENIEFHGEMRIKLKLMTNFPHAQTVSLCFVGKPVFNYVLKPIGGDTFGVDINCIPGLQSFIRDTVHAILGPMMYHPNVFTLNLEQLMSGTPLDAASGVLQIKIESARGLHSVKLGGGTPDPYVSVSIANRAEIARTKFKRSSYSPHFGSIHNILLNDGNMHETLTLTVLDHNERRKDTVLGVASFELALLVEDATQEGIIGKILREGRDSGELVFNVSYYPVLKPKTLDDGAIEPIPDTKVGIVRLTVHQAKDLDNSKSLTRDLNPHAKVLVDRKLIHTTPTYKHTLTPVWESACEFICMNKEDSVVTVKVIDDRDLLNDPVVGYLSMDLAYLLRAKEEQRDWFPLANAKTGRIRLTAEWKPLAMAGSVQGAAAYVPPIGVVRLWLQKAVDVKNVEAALGGKSDPYVRVVMGGITMARTEVVNNNLSPEWNQIVYVPVHTLSEVLVLETMDYQFMTKDRTLGYVELAIKDLARQNVDDIKYPFQSLGKLNKQDPIRLHGDTYKGKLHYVAEFVPAYNLRGLTFESRGTEMEGNMGSSSESGEDVASGDQASETDGDDIPEGITVQATKPKPDIAVGATVNGNGNGHQKAGSIDDRASMKTGGSKTSGTNEMNKTGGTVPEMPPAVPEQSGLEMSREDLFKQQSGVLIVEAVSGVLTKKARLELLLDEGYWPSFATERARSLQAKWDQVGEGFIKELDFCGIWLRLNENEEGLKDEIVGEAKMSATAFLDLCWNKEANFEFQNDRGETVGNVKLLSKYVPVPVKLEPRESINNMGLLRVEVISASNLRAADRGGKSDPYVLFELNGQRVFKSETIKKTLNPVWNQSFTCLVPSRIAAGFEAEVKDWDQLGNSDSLGTTKIDLSVLEPLEAREVVFPLSDPKHGQKGEIKLGLVFTPQIVAKARKATSTFAVGGRAMTQVASLPFGAAKGLGHGLGGAGAKAKNFFTGGRTKTIEESDEVTGFSIPVPQPPPKDNNGTSLTVPAPATPTHPADPPSGQVSQPAALAHLMHNGDFPVTNTAAFSGEGSAPREPGTLRVTVINAKDLSQSSDIKPYVTLKIGRKEYQTKHQAKTVTPEWDESFSFAVGPETESMALTVYDRKSFGKDKHLGEADVELWRHIQLKSQNQINPADVWVELREGTGSVKLRLDFEAGKLPQAGSAIMPRTPLSSPSRFTASRRTSNARRDGTPSIDT